MSNIEFIFPLAQLPLWLGAGGTVLLILAVLLRSLERRRGDRVNRFVEEKLAPRLLMGFDASIRRPLFWLTLGGFGFLALAFAQPHWGQTWQETTARSHDIIVCLDTSESMRAMNPLPDRMTRAKQKITSVVERASGDRFGLVAFSGAGELQCPLTRDHGYFRAVLNAIDTDTISLEGTDIAAALKVAINVFEAESEKTGNYDRNTRGILLISDGEEVSGDAIEAAEEASNYARVYVIGVGDPYGAKVEFPDWMKRYVTAPNMDEPHLSKLDEDTLRQVALAGDGAYKRSTPDNGDVNDIYGLIQTLNTAEVDSDVRMRLVNRYQWPLAAAIILLTAEGLWCVALPWARRRAAMRYNLEHGRKANA